MADAKQTVFSGKRFHVERVTATMPDGRAHAWDIVRHPGAVVILPLVDDGRVCLVRNYRVAAEQTLLELPAGTLEPGEAPLATAGRELAEETGYRADRLEHLLTFYSSPGILDERMHLFLATGLTAGPQALDAGEQIQPVLCTWDDLRAMIRRGEIRDAKSLAGLLYYQAFLGG